MNQTIILTNSNPKDMVKKKLPYQAPDIQETRVELESSICSGSVDIQNPDDRDHGRIQEQTINNDFNSDGFNTGGWTESN